MRLAAISVDLDEIPCYARIHGLGPPGEEGASAVYRKALPRFESLFAERSVPATFFAVGRDLGDPRNAEAIAVLHRQGHEIANHSASHFYDLTRRSEDVIRAEILDGARAIETVTGVRPVGFRAPGYTVTDRMLEILAESGHRYDSSVFPCPVYYLAKLFALATIRLTGRRSHSVMDAPRVLTAPADPYRVGTPYCRRGDGIVELPVGVTGNLSARLPYIGTTVMIRGKTGARLLTRLIAGRPLVNLELHGIDLCEAGEDGLDFLLEHRADLRRPLQSRIEALLAAVEMLSGAGYGFVTLAEAAERFANASR